MIKHAKWSMLVLSTLALLFACSGEKLELKVKARLDGQPAAQARVMVDGKEEGLTNADGTFSTVLARKPGAEVEVVVAKEMPGYRIKPWKNSFLMKLPKSGIVDTYSLDADLAATRYVTIAVTEKGAPVQDAVINASGKDMGKTDAKGEFVYEYSAVPKAGADIMVSKPGYASWRRTTMLEPGQRLEVMIAQRVVVTITALTDEYGQSSGVPGMSVTIDKQQAGTTDAKGVFTYTYNGEPGRKMQVTLSAPGYIPSAWKASVMLEGNVSLQHYFYPLTPKPIRTGMYRFVGNTPGLNLKDVLDQTEEAVSAQIFKNSCFAKVPSDVLQAEIKHAQLSIEKITAKGWRDTPLRRKVDMIILGSVAKDDKGFLIETKFYTSGGKLILSQLTRARNAGDLNSAAKEIAANIMERFPFEGTVVSKDENRFRINLGKSGYKITRGSEFTLMAVRLAESGKVSNFHTIGQLRVRKSEDAGSWMDVEDLKKGEKIAVGDRVIRRVYREEDAEAKNAFVISVKGGIPPDVSQLGGVNIYLDEEWVGFTGPDGKAEIPVRLGKKYDMVLYRHGYQQVKDHIKIEKNNDTREFVLQVNNSLLKVDSEPQSADVYLDGEKIGTTPLLEGKFVNLGFHTLKVTAGGDYRDWEEVMEFSQKIEDRSGERKIVLQKDYLKIGERAEQKGDMEGAIHAYQSTEKGHPDYSAAHSRLGRILLDEKSDYDGAIREFENVLSLPENQQLLYKQYAVVYTNLGHAYYEKGSALVQKDKEAAAQNFEKAIENLKKAKQNTRFFPTARYDEAVHDMYYYTALAYHKLYLITKKPAILASANIAWREYFDFFPKNLEGNVAFEQSRQTAQKYWEQIKNL